MKTWSTKIRKFSYCVLSIYPVLTINNKQIFRACLRLKSTSLVSRSPGWFSVIKNVSVKIRARYIKYIILLPYPYSKFERNGCTFFTTIFFRPNFFTLFFFVFYTNFFTSISFSKFQNLVEKKQKFWCTQIGVKKHKFWYKKLV